MERRKNENAIGIERKALGGENLKEKKKLLRLHLLPSSTAFSLLNHMVIYGLAGLPVTICKDASCLRTHGTKDFILFLRNIWLYDSLIYT